MYNVHQHGQYRFGTFALDTVDTAESDCCGGLRPSTEDEQQWCQLISFLMTVALFVWLDWQVTCTSMITEQNSLYFMRRKDKCVPLH